MIIRPLSPSDVPGLRALIDRLTPAERRARFGYALRRLPDTVMSAWCTPDGKRSLAYGLLEPVTPAACVAETGAMPLEIASPAQSPSAVLRGWVQASVDPDQAQAELAVVLEQVVTGQGWGRRLVTRIMEDLVVLGVRSAVVRTDVDNLRMRRMAHCMGFTRSGSDDATQCVWVRTVGVPDRSSMPADCSTAWAPPGSHTDRAPSVFHDHLCSQPPSALAY